MKENASMRHKSSSRGCESIHKDESLFLKCIVAILFVAS